MGPDDGVLTLVLMMGLQAIGIKEADDGFQAMVHRGWYDMEASLEAERVVLSDKGRKFARKLWETLPDSVQEELYRIDAEAETAE